MLLCCACEQVGLPFVCGGVGNGCTWWWHLSPSVSEVTAATHFLLPSLLSSSHTWPSREAGCGLFWKWNWEIRGGCKVWTGALPHTHTELLTGASLWSLAPECNFTVCLFCVALLEFPAWLLPFLILQIYFWFNGSANMKIWRIIKAQPRSHGHRSNNNSYVLASVWRHSISQDVPWRYVRRLP